MAYVTVDVPEELIQEIVNRGLGIDYVNDLFTYYLCEWLDQDVLKIDLEDAQEDFIQKMKEEL